MQNSIPPATLTSNPLNALLPIHIDGFEQLAALALDMRWSWDHASDSLWRTLDAELWELTRNPWAVLQTVSHAQIETLLKQPDYRQEVDRLLKSQQQARVAPAWFQQQYPDSQLKCVAYFSMEFMLSTALPIYSGGLGMAQLTPRFSVMRTLREYTEQCYLPASVVYHQRAASQGLLAANIVAAQNSINQHWDDIHFGARRDSQRDGQHYVEVEVYLNDLTDQQITLELYADATQIADATRHPMHLREPDATITTPRIYYAYIPDHRPVTDFTARVIARIEGASTPLEDSHIRWQE